jgi:hypothetical protein
VNINKWLKDRGFKLSAKGRRYGIRPRLVLDNVEIHHADKHGIDVWVNNAMESVFSPVIDTTPDEWASVPGGCRMHGRAGHRRQRLYSGDRKSVV